MKLSGVNPTEILQQINKLKEDYVKMYKTKQSSKVIEIYIIVFLSKSKKDKLNI
jgi:hypothetical protein